MGDKHFFSAAVGAVLICAVVAAVPAAAQPTPVLYVIGGNVGISTSQPKAKLHVLLGGTPYTLHPQTAMAFQNDASPTDGVIFALLGGTGASANGQIVFGNSANQFEGRLVYTFSGGGAMRFFAGGGEKARITAAGNVGIGTASPAARLDVNGAIFQRGGVVHPDFVFEPGYPIESIEEHSDYMWSNKHLPAVGPGRYDEEGRSIIEVGANSAALLEELEKAHIYIEQLHRRLKVLEEAVLDGGALEPAEVGEARDAARVGAAGGAAGG